MSICKYDLPEASLDRKVDDFELTTPEGRFENERADCVVCAIATAYQIPYKQAFELVRESCGRGPRERTFGLMGLMGYLCKRKLNRKTTRRVPFKVWEKTPGLRSLRKGLDKGVFLVRVTGHLTTIKDGVVLDSWDPGKAVIKSVWNVS